MMTLEAYMSTLLSEHAVTNVVIVRDDAVSTSSIRPEFIPRPVAKSSRQIRPSLTNAAERCCPAPKLPYRKSSSDDLLLLNHTDRKSRARRYQPPSTMNNMLLPTEVLKERNVDRAESILSPEGRNRRQLFQEIFAEVDTLFEETQRRASYTNHAA
eukprot:scaffold6708_cov134-Cylindrotheca_fusiformis.AAC.31